MKFKRCYIKPNLSKCSLKELVYLYQENKVLTNEIVSRICLNDDLSDINTRLEVHSMISLEVQQIITSFTGGCKNRLLEKERAKKLDITLINLFNFYATLPDIKAHQSAMKNSEIVIDKAVKIEVQLEQDIINWDDQSLSETYIQLLDIYTIRMDNNKHKQDLLDIIIDDFNAANSIIQSELKARANKSQLSIRFEMRAEEIRKTLDHFGNYAKHISTNESNDEPF